MLCYFLLRFKKNWCKRLPKFLGSTKKQKHQTEEQIK